MNAELRSCFLMLSTAAFTSVRFLGTWVGPVPYQGCTSPEFRMGRIPWSKFQTTANKSYCSGLKSEHLGRVRYYRYFAPVVVCAIIGQFQSLSSATSSLVERLNFIHGAYALGNNLSCINHYPCYNVIHPSISNFETSLRFRFCFWF